MRFHGDPAEPHSTAAETTKDLRVLVWGAANSIHDFVRAIEEANKLAKIVTGEGEYPDTLDRASFAKTMADQWRRSFGALVGDDPEEGTDGNSGTSA